MGDSGRSREQRRYFACFDSNDLLMMGLCGAF